MRLLKLNGCFLLQRFGMTGLVPCSRRSSRSSALSYALSPSIRFDGFTNEALCDRAIVCFTCGQQDGDKAPFNICECVNLRIVPSARAANSLLFLPPFSACCRAVGFNVRGIDHLRVCGSSVPRKLPKQVFPDAAPRPPHKAVIDRGRRTILRRAIAPATAALQYMHNAADDPTIVRPLDAPNIRRQARFDPLPLLIAQPKQVSAHDPNPLPKRIRIVLSERKN